MNDRQENKRWGSGADVETVNVCTRGDKTLQRGVVRDYGVWQDERPHRQVQVIRLRG